MSTALSEAMRDEEPAAPPDIRRLGPLWGWLRGLLIAYIVVSAISLLAMIVNIALWRAVESDTLGEVDYYTMALLSDGVLGLAGIAYLIVFAWCGFLFLRFTYRAMRNLWRLDAKDVKVPPGWAVAWYFIPIAWLWKPLQAVREIWRNTENFDQPRLARVPAAIGWWWALWIINMIIGNISFQMAMNSGYFADDGFVDPSAMQVINTLDLTAAAFDILIAMLALSFMGRIARMQDERFYMARQF